MDDSFVAAPKNRPCKKFVMAGFDPATQRARGSAAKNARRKSLSVA